MSKTNVEHIESLLGEFSEQREALKKMVVELDELRGKIDTIFPDKLDQRYSRFFEEKVKAATELFKTIVSMRKEIHGSLKDEIELRRKIDFDTDGGDISDQIDLQAISKKLRLFETAKNKLVENTKGE